jgi:type VI secretion system secreted protein VgrG
MPPRYSQQNRAFRVSVGSLEQDFLLLDGFSLNSRVSEPYQLTLQLLSEDDAVDPASILREPFLVAIGLPDGSDRFIHGFCNRFAQRGKGEDLTSYEAEIVPWLWFLSLNQDCHVFQEMTVLEILDEVFGKYGHADYEIRCVESYPVKEYCVQYRESDLDFVSRLMEEEGIFYFFEHSEEGHKLIIADDSSAIQECEGQEQFRVATTPDARFDEDIIEELEREHQVYTTRVTLTDYDPLQPSMDLASSASDESYEELYDFPGRYERLPDGERCAMIRLQERAAAQQVVRGSGRCRAFRTGYKFDLTEHYRADTNQNYFLLAVWESGYNGGYRAQAGEAEYSNQFECVPASIYYRPARRTPKPVIHGSQTAFVVGPAGEEIYTDEHGRVKVQFHWDRQGTRDENSSLWIRVSHPWAGKGWGAVSIPRIGQEVIVDFLEGDPDRPIITGRVYNAEAMPPYGLPDGGVVSGIKSATHKGSGYNEMSMNDTAGEEMFTIHGQYDMSTTVLHDKTTTVKNDDTQTVESNRTITVNGTHTETIKKDTKITITEGDHSTAVSAGKQSNTVSKEIEIKSETSSIKIEAATQIELKVGASTLLMKSDGSIKLEGVSVAIEGKAKVAIHGAMVSSEADATHNTKGAIVLSEGSATNTVKGGMVMLNP